jgi:hypothetical protein
MLAQATVPTVARAKKSPADGRGKNARCIALIVTIIIVANSLIRQISLISVIRRGPTGSNMRAGFLEGPSTYYAQHAGDEGARQTRPRPKIGIVSSYISSTMWKGSPTKISELDHLINKACYSKLWGYDFIFNMTPGYGAELTDSRHWLEYGCWHRVPQLQAALPNYDWILYGDIDYVIKDLTRPLESFLNELDLYGHKNVHIILPSDSDDRGQYAFSSYAIMVRNSPFGHRLLEHWMAYGMGLCPNGNHKSIKGKYDWTDGDQSGLWYALIKTHMDFNPGFKYHPSNFPICNETSGLLADGQGGPWHAISGYFNKNGAKRGSSGAALGKVPQDQEIIWTLNTKGSRSGLGLQMNWGVFGDELWPWAFAIHKKDASEWPKDMISELEMCKVKQGCYAEYKRIGNSSEEELKIGCSNLTYF